ncbi:hypothetical protein [Paracoccus tibetensis]|uniref:Uncharacterized protein n=1 Tax=Paracoccus tibetensis TaxID=336292 RepID=A0A1G5IPK5_9RHOB|nr:hypothetical protein [Paracoccus tibetensis]SCY78016.1 hypothetical protein SAMN05660710_02745 [Paracoccus tibetensis]
MLTNPLKAVLIGGKTAALAALLATTAAAQTAVPTPEGNVVVIPEAALEAESRSVLVESDYPVLTSFDNDQVIAETLIGQGFTNVVINRTGPILTITATRDGVPIELVYSTANGRLMSVDGVEFRHPSDAAAASEPGRGSTGASDAVSDGAADDSADDADGAAADGDAADGAGDSDGADSEAGDAGEGGDGGSDGGEGEGEGGEGEGEGGGTDG